jgi:hypothetical protein
MKSFRDIQLEYLVRQGLAEAIDDDQMIKYKDDDGESKEMKASSAKTMAKDHPAKIEYDKLNAKDGDDKEVEKGVNIFDPEKPADEPSPDKTGELGDDAKQIGGPNGLEIDRDDIQATLMNDPEMVAILGDEDDVYWDDVDLVSSKHDDQTIASIDPDSSETIGDLKQKIKDFAAEKEKEQQARDSQEFEKVENDKDINRMQQGMQDAIGGDDYEDVPDRLELQGKMKADNGETIVVWKDTDDGMMMGVDKDGNVYEDGEKKNYSVGVSTTSSAFEDGDDSDDEKQYKVDDLRDEIEDLTMEIEDYDEQMEDAKRDYDEAMAVGDEEEAKDAEIEMEDIKQDKMNAQKKLEAAKKELSGMDESIRNSSNILIENWQSRISNILSDQKGHISKHNPARAFAPIKEDADDDMKAAKKIKRTLQNILFDIDNAEEIINKNLSGFMSPGLRAAFYDAVKAGTKKQGKFDVMAAGKVLNNYYKR